MGKYDFGAEPLPKVKCISANCKEDLHCFRPEKENPHKLVGGKCSFCEADLVDWNRVHKMDINDTEATFSFLKKENIRSHFWNMTLSSNFRLKSITQGKIKLEDRVVKRLKKSVSCPGDKIFRDGTQTPTTKWEIIYFAQHATATCCRKCIKYWHGIPYDRDLSEEELEYLKNLIMKFIDEKIGEMPDVENFQLELKFNKS